LLKKRALKKTPTDRLLYLRGGLPHGTSPLCVYANALASEPDIAVDAMVRRRVNGQQMPTLKGRHEPDGDAIP
jgi:hypothetical protein